VAALIADAAAAVGVPYTVVQGSWSDSVGASAGTHAGGGAFDLRSRDYTRAQALALVVELRKRNVCAWWRTPEFGWPATAGGPHIHGIVRDEPGLAPAAQRQVSDYDRGLNGLASQARDPFPRPPQAPFVETRKAPPPMSAYVVKDAQSSSIYLVGPRGRVGLDLNGWEALRQCGVPGADNPPDALQQQMDIAVGLLARVE
jgi:hypothetical protein